jgi:hypothetical protein
MELANAKNMSRGLQLVAGVKKHILSDVEKRGFVASDPIYRQQPTMA